jgi:hypothetical protein
VLVKVERLQVYYDLDLLQRWALGKQTFFKEGGGGGNFLLSYLFL